MEFYDAARPIFFTSRIFALAPFTFTSKLGYRKSLSLLAYSIFVSIFFSGITYPIALSINIASNDSSGVLTIALIILTFFGSVFFIVTRWLCYTSRDDVIRITNTMATLSTDLIRSPSSYRHFFWFLVVQEVAVFATISMTTVVNYSLWKSSTAVLAVLVIGNLTTFSSSHAELQFNAMVLMTGRLFAGLNEKLEDFEKRFRLHSDAATSVSRQLSSPSTDELVTEIRVLATQHSSLCAMSRVVDSSFGVQNLLALARTFVTLVFALFYAFLYVLGGRVDGELQPGTFVLWVFEYSVRTLMLVGACYGATSQAERVSNHVAKLLKSAKDPTLKDEVHAFSLQLLHNEVRFSAWELFPLDATLLGSIIGSVTTYLVILIQFQLASK